MAPDFFTAETVASTLPQSSSARPIKATISKQLCAPGCAQINKMSVSMQKNFCELCGSVAKNPFCPA